MNNTIADFILHVSDLFYGSYRANPTDIGLSAKADRYASFSRVVRTFPVDVSHFNSHDFRLLKNSDCFIAGCIMRFLGGIHDNILEKMKGKALLPINSGPNQYLADFLELESSVIWTKDMKKSNLLFFEARRIRNTSRVVLSSNDYLNGNKSLVSIDSKIKVFFTEQLALLNKESFNDYLLGVLKEFSENGNEDFVLKRLAFLLSNRHKRLHSLFKDSKFPSEYLEDDSSTVFTLDGVSYISDSCRTRIVSLRSCVRPSRVYLQEGLYSILTIGTEVSSHLVYIIR